MIIRILPTKMFYGFQEWEDERQRTSAQMAEFRKESHDILEHMFVSVITDAPGVFDTSLKNMAFRQGI